MNQFLFEFLINNPQCSMSVYKHPYTGATQFTFSDVITYENIVLNWVYNKFIISYKNEIFDINIRSSSNHFLHNTLCFGQCFFEKLMWDVAQIKKIKRRFGMVKIIQEYFLNKENEILIYRPTVDEIIFKITEINEEKKPGNRTCCCCLEHRYISDEPKFQCQHVELCRSCFFKLEKNQCPLCRSGLPL